MYINVYVCAKETHKGYSYFSHSYEFLLFYLNKFSGIL